MPNCLPAELFCTLVELGSGECCSCGNCSGVCLAANPAFLCLWCCHLAGIRMGVTCVRLAVALPCLIMFASCSFQGVCGLFFSRGLQKMVHGYGAPSFILTECSAFISPEVQVMHAVGMIWHPPQTARLTGCGQGSCLRTSILSCFFPTATKTWAAQVALGQLG